MRREEERRAAQVFSCYMIKIPLPSERKTVDTLLPIDMIGLIVLKVLTSLGWGDAIMPHTL